MEQRQDDLKTFFVVKIGKGCSSFTTYGETGDMELETREPRLAHR